MALKKVISVEDAIAIVHDGDVLATTGYGGNGTPDFLMRALEKRFLESGTPRALTLVWAGGQGDAKDKGLNHLGHEGLIRRAIGGHYGLMPKVEQLAVQNKIEAYNLPEGVIVHLYRDIAARKPGTLSTVGLGTFVDPRVEGGRMNEVTREELVRLVQFDGEESLFFKAFPINVVFIRGTTADPNGNITMERESLILENLALAMAAKNSGGYVICQVERVAAEGSLDSRQVRIPGILVDCVVQAEAEHHMQTYGTQYNPAYSGEVNIPLAAIKPLPLDERKVIARRAAMELSPNSVVTLGVGLPDAIGNVVGEERIQDLVTPVLDPGVIGGVPMGGLDFGAVVNKQAAIDHCSAFDFVDGGGLDGAFLGFAECDRHGNVNASRFAKRISGCGGFINISQNTRKVVFVGTFSSSGLEVALEDGRLRIVKEGKFLKFVDAVGQITFSGRYAAGRDQDVLYITERCVFRLTREGLRLIEVAPGIDPERDVLRHLPFRPFVDGVATMDAAIFQPRPMGLRGRMLDIHIDQRISYDPASNTLYLNYAGMRVRSEDDIRDIVVAVEKVLKPLGRRVNAIVNYDRFEADDEVRDAYLDAVRYVESNYYLKVSRYTNSGFLRIVFGSELSKRKVSSRLFTTIDEARRNLSEGN
jgi:propionate CoA-transferase